MHTHTQQFSVTSLPEMIRDTEGISHESLPDVKYVAIQ